MLSPFARKRPLASERGNNSQNTAGKASLSKISSYFTLSPLILYSITFLIPLVPCFHQSSRDLQAVSSGQFCSRARGCSHRPKNTVLLLLLRQRGFQRVEFSLAQMFYIILVSSLKFLSFRIYYRSKSSLFLIFPSFRFFPGFQRQDLLQIHFRNQVELEAVLCPLSYISR